jgi:hypothetical protein
MPLPWAFNIRSRLHPPAVKACSQPFSAYNLNRMLLIQVMVIIFILMVNMKAMIRHLEARYTNIIIRLA